MSRWARQRPASLAGLFYLYVKQNSIGILILVIAATTIRRDLMATRTPLTLSEDGKTHEPMQALDTVPTSVIPVSGASGNLAQMAPDGIYAKLNTDQDGIPSIGTAGDGTASSPLKCFLNVSPRSDNIISELADGLYGRVPISSATGNLATMKPDGLHASITTDQAGNTSIGVDGDGSSASPLQYSLKVSQQSGNTLQPLADGLYVPPSDASVQISDTPGNKLTADNPGGALYVPPATWNPMDSEFVWTGTGGTVSPELDPRYDGELITIRALNPGTEVTLALANIPQHAKERIGYCIRVCLVAEYEGGQSSELRVTTPSGSRLITPNGKISTTDGSTYAYPFPNTKNQIGIVDVINVSAGGVVQWALREVAPTTTPTMTFKLFVNNSGVGNFLVPSTLVKFPQHMIDSDWAMRASVVCTTTGSHTRSIKVSLGDTVLYNGSMSLIANMPFFVPVPPVTFIGAPWLDGKGVGLKRLRVEVGNAVTASVVINAKLICERVVKNSTLLDVF